MNNEFGDDELERRIRTLYLHPKMKMITLKEVEIIIPPVMTNYQDSTRKIIVPKGTIMTLISLIPICVSSGQELKIVLPVRIDKLPVEIEDNQLITAEIAVPIEAIAIHPDEL